MSSNDTPVPVSVSTPVPTPTHTTLVEGREEVDGVRQVKVWCHACQQQKLATSTRGRQAQASSSLPEEESDEQEILVCPSCGSDFVEELPEERATGTANSGRDGFGSTRQRAVHTHNLDALFSGQMPPMPPTSQAPGSLNGVEQPNGYRILHGPISVRVEARGHSPLLLQSILGGGLGQGVGNLGDFVFHNEALERVLAQLAENHVVPAAPASPQVIAKLQRIRCKEELRGCTSENCSICQDGYEDDNFTAIKMPCGHIFHEECLLRWLKEQNTCPICRHKLAVAGEEERATTIASATETQSEGEEERNDPLSEELIRVMNDIDEDPPFSPNRGDAATAGSAAITTTTTTREEPPAYNIFRLRKRKVELRKVGVFITRKLAPLGNAFRWVSKPVGKVLQLGLSLTDKILRK